MVDYVIVGAGSAGCVLAARLSEDPKTKVVLIEAGPEPRNPWIRIPAGLGRLIFPGRYNWGYFTEPVPSLNNRRVYAPRGKTLGGSSAINGMAYVRGNAVDYDSWRQLGNVGWSYADVLPYFKKIERRAGGDPAFRSETGPLSITDPLVQHSTSKDFVEAGIRFGLPRNPDYNGAYQEGASFLQQNIRDGRRHSTADAFLMPARRRPNLEVITDAHVQNIEFEGRRAVAVNYERGGINHSIRADREIILSAGSLNSPKLLMLSGVGPAQELKAMGLPVVADSPGVGKNLQDHLYINYRARSKSRSSINRELRGLRRYMHGLHYILTHRGMLTMTGTQAAAFIRVMPGAGSPDVQIMFRPYSWNLSPSGGLEVLEEPTVSASFTPLRPQSSGEVRLKSPNVSDAPEIHPNYLAAAADRDVVVAGIRTLRQLFATEPLASHIVSELAPGEACQSDAAVLEFVRNTAESMHHWSGTCKMGSDPMAVVDDQLRVRSIDRLRVIDASIMPRVTSGNTNAPTIMIGEKGAALIKAAGVV